VLRCISLALTVCLGAALVLSAIASADWGGTDPARNYPLGDLPLACTSAPTGEKCVNAGVYYLDRARAKVGLRPYKLPAGFPAMPPARQMFILTNLDRIAYGVPPMTGLTVKLNVDALRGVRQAYDPSPSDTSNLRAWTANWATGYANAPMAYEAWMWDDGPGSSNTDCTSSNRSACWAHRHGLLWRFGSGRVLAMGAAAGFGPTRLRAYTTLLVGGARPGYTAKYAYTWRKAVAGGAGRNTYDPGKP
jgi:hypothetical protein